MLSALIFTPLAGAVLLLAMPKDRTKAIRIVAGVFSGLALALSLYMAAHFDPGMADPQMPQFHERYSWIPAFNIFYRIGVDGLSLPLVLLTTLLSFLACVGSFNINNRVKEYFFFFLILETGLVGVFCALDFFLFYIFWEIVLVPMYFLIGIWGGPQKEYAAIKFFLYTLVGSVIMLVGILALYFRSSPHTFDILSLRSQASDPLTAALFTGSFGKWVFLAFFVGFAIKVPLFPFHTWLPLAHVEAPTAVSVILAGVLLKMGTYGFMRISWPILPEAAKALAYPVAIIAVINIVYGAFCAMAQKDIKRMVAYSSINHMGYCMLGMASMTAIGMNGALLQMITHGLITGSLFLLVGVIYDRAHTRDIDAFGGLGQKTPVFAGVATVMVLASLGLPMLAGFVSEFLCFLGAFESSVTRSLVPFAMVGVVITAAFFLVLLQRVFLGNLPDRWKEFTDMDLREKVAVIPLLVLTIWIGVYPSYMIKIQDEAVRTLSSIFTVATPAQYPVPSPYQPRPSQSFGGGESPGVRPAVRQKRGADETPPGRWSPARP